MSQENALMVAYRVVLIADVLAILLFTVRYHIMTKGAVWSNEIGRTIVVKDVLLILCLLPSILSFFWHFSRLTSHIAGWIDVVLIGLLAPVMIWRTIVWQRIHAGKETAASAEGRRGVPAASPAASYPQAPPTEHLSSGQPGDQPAEP